MGETCRDVPLYAVYYRPVDFVSRSGLEPLAEVLGAHKLVHGCYWRAGGRVNWRVEEWLKRWGERYYGSPWNYLAPVLDEYRLASRIPKGRSIVHFLFAEFAGPRVASPFRCRGAKLVGTFHASPRRQESVNGGMPLQVYDRISVVAHSQRSFFEARGYPAERIFVTHHGVDTRFFAPDPMRVRTTPAPLQGLLVGSTERDHEFAAKLMCSLPDGVMRLAVAAKPRPHPAYQGVKHVDLLPMLDDAAMLKAYQSADILVIPLLDSTANNAILESMACGTPVMTNRTGGTDDYVSDACNDVLDGKNLEEWRDRILYWVDHREELQARRPVVRQWAETLSWEAVAGQYRALYKGLWPEG